MTDAPSTDAYLLCRLGASVCAVPLVHVSETMRPLPVEPLSGVPGFLLGVAVIRGAPTPVVDAGKLIGAVAHDARRFVTLKTGGRVTALAVESVLGIRRLPAAALAAVPPLVREAAGDTLRAVAALDSELTFVLDAARLIPEPLWSAIEGHEVSR